MSGTAGNDERGRAHFTYIWKIENVPRYGVHRSPVFTIQSTEMTKWVLIIFTYFNGGAKLGIERAKCDGGPESIEMEFIISIFDINESLLYEIFCKEHFNEKKVKSTPKHFQIPGWDNLFDKRGNNLFPKDRLTVRCCLWRTKTEISTFEMCFARTRFDVYHPSCVWAIKGFSSLKEGEKRIRTLNSTTKGCPKLILSLSVAEKNGNGCLFLHLEAPESNYHYQVDAEIAVLDAKGMGFHFKRVFTYLIKKNESIELSVIEKSNLMDVLSSDDVLLLRCELKLTSSAPVWSRIEDYRLMDYPDSKLAQPEESDAHFDGLNETADCPLKEMVKKFREDGIFCDVSLRSGTESFLVHKLILSIRSSAFSAMFSKDMSEKTRKCIDIPDIDPDTLGRLLLYIYDDKIQDLAWVDGVNLFVAADKYQLLDLKEKCSCFLKSNISESNVCEILGLADVHHDESLKKSTQEFMLDHLEVINSSAWKVFRENHPKLALETTENIIGIIKYSIF